MHSAGRSTVIMDALYSCGSFLSLSRCNKGTCDKSATSRLRRHTLSSYRPTGSSRVARTALTNESRQKQGYRVPGAECVISSGAPRASWCYVFRDLEKFSESNGLVESILRHDNSFKYIHVFPSEIISTEFHASTVNPPKIPDDSLTCLSSRPILNGGHVLVLSQGNGIYASFSALHFVTQLAAAVINVTKIIRR